MTATAPETVAPVGRGSDEIAEPPQRLSLDVVIEDDAWLALGDVESWIERAVAALSQRLPHGTGTAALALDADAAVQRLNKDYRGLDKPTNVLSFSSGDLTGAHLGDIIFARETILHEAVDLGVPVAHHIQHLTVHGLLHLLGFDHETDAEATVMEALETRILSDLGVPDPYAQSDPA